MTPSVEEGRQVMSDTGNVNIFATPGNALPTSADKLASDLVELRVELRADLRAEFRAQTEDVSTGINAQICVQNKKFEQKFETMFQTFMERSRVKIIKQAADKNHHHTDALDNSLPMLDKRVEFFRREIDVRTTTEKGFQDSVKTTVKTTTNNHETLTKHVERDSKNLATFQRELPVREEVTKKHLDEVHEKMSTVQSSLDDAFRQK